MDYVANIYVIAFYRCTKVIRCKFTLTFGLRSVERPSRFVEIEVQVAFQDKPVNNSSYFLFTKPLSF